MHGRKPDKRINEGRTPPAKRARFIARSTSQISSSSATSAAPESLGTQLRDWMTWIAANPISWIASKTPILSRLFSGDNNKNRDMATSTSEPKQTVRKWKVMKKEERQSVPLKRPPLHHEENRFMSLQEKPQLRNQAFSSGNPFYGPSGPTAINSRDVENVPPPRTRGASGNLLLSYRQESGPYEASGRATTARTPKQKPKSKRTMMTARESMRLEEKEQYRLLISQCSQDYGSMVQKPTVFRSKATQKGSSPKPIKPHIMAFGQESLSAESKKNMTKWLKSTKKDRPSESQDHLPSYQKPDTTIDSDLEITKVELPLRKKPSSVSPRKSSLFSNEWIQDLKRTISIDSKDNMRQIQEQERKARLMQEKREARLSSENTKLFERVRRTTILPESPEASDEEEDASQYPELASDMDAKVEDALRPSPPDEILVEGFQLSVTRRDMETLSGLNWLNDEIINFYMNMLSERGKMDNFPSVYAFNTFFYPKLISSGHSALKRWTRKVDIFSYNYILIPVHLGMHWCLAVIDFSQKKIQYYDSMGGQNNECLHALSSYLKEECLDKKKTDFDMNDWKSEAVKNIPHQMNGSDCGMFALKYAEYLTRNSKITFSQAHMPYFRRRMVYEILMKQLL